MNKFEIGHKVKIRKNSEDYNLFSSNFGIITEIDKSYAPYKVCFSSEEKDFGWFNILELKLVKEKISVKLEWKKSGAFYRCWTSICTKNSQYSITKTRHDIYLTELIKACKNKPYQYKAIHLTNATSLVEAKKYCEEYANNKKDKS